MELLKMIKFVKDKSFFIFVKRIQINEHKMRRNYDYIPL